MASISSYELIDIRESVQQQDTPHAAHCLIWYEALHPEFGPIVYVLMQMRSDGYIGFPGGVVDESVSDESDILIGLHRELKEEINCDKGLVTITRADLIGSQKRSSSASSVDMILHFFAKKVDEATFNYIERNHTKASDFISESLGVFRVPIYCSDMSRTKLFWDNFAKFPFIGNAREQLHVSLVKLNVIDAQQLSFLTQ